MADLNLYHVTTPEQTYANMNVVEYSMRRSVERGVTLLWADIRMQEVRLTAGSSIVSTKNPSGAAKQNSGNVQAQSSSASAVSSGDIS